MELGISHIYVFSPPREGEEPGLEQGYSGWETSAMERDLRKGSARVLILTVLAEKPMYGYQIVKELKRRSKGYFVFKEGTLYPALHGMEKEGLLTSEWQVVQKGPSRKYYHITEAGRNALAASTREWTTFSKRLLSILGEGRAEPASG
jgi:PadR family transcriptional regulator PadR